MPILWIATDEKQIWFGEWEYVKKQPHTRACMEIVSEELFVALLKYWGMEQTKKSVSYILYDILETRCPTNN